jgi:flagellar biosynthesis protein FlhF
MKIRTFSARDMKNALRQVRDEVGPDAVILSTRHLERGVEVTVAMEPEQVLLAELPVAQQVATRAATPDPAEDFAAVLARTADAAPAAAMNTAPDPQLGSELRSMRQLLEAQVAQLAWNDLSRRSPATAELLRDLTAMGLAGPLAAELLKELPAGISPDDAQRRALAGLARRIHTTGDALLDNGGRVAFVGPTGVGKTTGIAKLAARWVMRHGPRDIALVSLDDARFGAHEQLRVLGRLLGVESFTLDGVANLEGLLSRLPRHRLLLIDTEGLSPRDAQLASRAAAFREVATRTGVTPWLTLSASAQAGVIEDAVRGFAAFDPRAVLLTKLDEAACLGGALSALATSALPVSYVAGGPRIPEDLAPARGHQLVARAYFLARSSDASVGEELLVRRFGRLVHGLR